MSLKLDVMEQGLRDHFERCHMSGNDKDMAAIDAAYTAALGPTTSNVTGYGKPPAQAWSGITIN